jgi:exosortase family protein XrtF
MTSASAKPNFRLLSGSPFLQFVLTGAVLYALWYFSYEFYLKPSTAIDEWIIDALTKGADSLLRTLGYSMKTFEDGVWRTHVAIAGSKGVTVGAPCDGLVLFALFTVFVLAYPGSWKHRLWFIPSGLLLIQLLNTARIAALTWIVHYNENWLAFNHDYTFTVFVYGVVFGLWYIWVNRFGAKSTNKSGL